MTWQLATTTTAASTTLASAALSVFNSYYDSDGCRKITSRQRVTTLTIYIFLLVVWFVFFFLFWFVFQQDTLLLPIDVDTIKESKNTTNTQLTDVFWCCKIHPPQIQKSLFQGKTCLLMIVSSLLEVSRNKWTEHFFSTVYSFSFVF